MQTLTLHKEALFSRIIFARQDKKLNVLDDICMQDFASVLDQLESELPNHVIIQSGMPKCFIAGADIDVIANQEDETQAKALAERGQLLFRRLENLSCQTIAVVQGACLGGGLELALACNHIIAVDDASTQIGLPEIKLGIHPGFGGCVRLPKRVGWPKAIEMVMSGQSIHAKKAKKLGLASLCCDALSIAQAEAYLIKQEIPRKSQTPVWFHLWPLRKLFFMQVKKRVLQKVPNAQAYPALQATLNLLEELYGMSDGLALAREAESLGALAVTPSCHNLIRVFKLGQSLKNQNNATQDVNPVPQVHKIAVYGAGIMGSGIAWLAAKKHQVDLHELSAETLSQGMLQLDTLARWDAPRLMNIRPTLNDSGLSKVQMVVEAVSENMQLKQQLWQHVEAQVATDCLLLSNTSSLSITEMQACLKYPQRMAGLHFFNPVHKMPLVEIIAGQHTDEKVIQTLCALMSAWGKYPIVVKDCPGFLVNRCLLPYIKSAIALFDQGQSVEYIDQCLKKFGLPMGAFELMDRIGLDICQHVGTQLAHDFPTWFESMVKGDMLGSKTKQGFFLYQDKIRLNVNPELNTYACQQSSETWSCSRITDACLLPMLLEAWHCLDENIVSHKDHLDAAMVYGLGFPAFHGGLLHYFAQQDQTDLLQRMVNLSLDVERFKQAV